MERTHDLIDFVPTSEQQKAAHAARVRAWIEAQGILPLLTNRSAEDVHGYEGGRLYMHLFGYLPAPDVLDGTVQCETTLTLDTQEDFSERFEDPNGDWWTRKRLRANVSWYSGGLPTRAARVRLDCIIQTQDLAEKFDAAFGADYIWSPGPTKAARLEAGIQLQRDATKIKCASHIQQAIHTSCPRMRVGDERFITPPKGDLLAGEYTVEVEKKTYKVTVRDDPAMVRFQFMRTQ